MKLSRFVPWLLAGLGAIYLMMTATSAKDSENGMHLADFACTASRLAVHHERSRDRDQVGKTPGEPFFEPAANCPAAHLVKCVAIPPALHIGLAKREGAAGKEARKEARIVHLNVPGAGAVDFDVGRAEKILDHISCR